MDVHLNFRWSRLLRNSSQCHSATVLCLLRIKEELRLRLCLLVFHWLCYLRTISVVCLDWAGSRLELFRLLRCCWVCASSALRRMMPLRSLSKMDWRTLRIDFVLWTGLRITSRHSFQCWTCQLDSSWISCASLRLCTSLRPRSKFSLKELLCSACCSRFHWSFWCERSTTLPLLILARNW